MKILHIITSLNDGGAEGVLYRLIINDNVNRHIVISLIDSGKYGPLLTQAGIEVHCLRMTSCTFRLSPLIRLWRLIKLIRPDVVQTWMYHANLVGGVFARLAGISAVAWGIRSGKFQYGKSKLSTILVICICSFLSWFIPRRIISCSKSSAAYHIALGYDGSKMVTIPNGYSLVKFKPDSDSGKLFRLKFNLDCDTLILGLVGRFHPQKDHFTFFQALALLKSYEKKFKIILAGTEINHYNIQLQEWISSFSLTHEIYLLGPQSDISALMNALDFHVLSSSFGEAFPNVLAEAMACGTPCITTDVGDAALIVGDTGWVVPHSNPVALANSLNIAIEEPLAKRLQRGQLARDRILNLFSLDQMVQSYSDTYSSMMKTS